MALVTVSDISFAKIRPAVPFIKILLLPFILKRISVDLLSGNAVSNLLVALDIIVLLIPIWLLEGYIIEKKCEESAISTSDLYLIHTASIVPEPTQQLRRLFRSASHLALIGYTTPLEVKKSNNVHFCRVRIKRESSSNTNCDIPLRYCRI